MKKHQPALLGGLFIGVLSSLPFVNMANCCCLWVIGGGVLTAYLIQQSKPEPIQSGEAVLGGLIAGLIGAVIVTLANLALSSITGPMMQDQLQRVFERSQEMPPEMRDMIMNLTSGKNMLLLGLVINLPVYAIFGMLGSLLGTAFFKKKVAPPAQL